MADVTSVNLLDDVRAGMRVQIETASGGSYTLVRGANRAVFLTGGRYNGFPLVISPTHPTMTVGEIYLLFVEGGQPLRISKLETIRVFDR